MATITPLPVTPARTDPPEVFVVRADNFIAALPRFGNELNEQAKEIVGAVDASQRYYPPSATDPATRPNGTPVQDGDQYFNTTTTNLMIRSKGVWTPAALTPGAYVSSSGGTISGPITFSSGTGNSEIFVEKDVNNFRVRTGPSTGYKYSYFTANGDIQSAASLVAGSGTITLNNGTKTATINTPPNAHALSITTGALGGVKTSTFQENGDIVAANNIVAPGYLQAGVNSPSGSIFFSDGRNGARSVTYTGSYYSMPGAELQVNGGEVLRQGKSAALSTGSTADDFFTTRTNDPLTNWSSNLNPTLTISTNVSGGNALMQFYSAGVYQIKMGVASGGAAGYFYLGGGSVGNGVMQMSIAPNGDTVFRGNVTAYSDLRFKSEITQLKGVVSRLLSMPNGGFTYIDNRTGDIKVGVGAQDVVKVFPEAVVYDERGHMSVAYGNLAMATLVESVRELKALIDKQQTEIDTLKEKLHGN